jgi:hypothetical protein
MWFRQLPRYLGFSIAVFVAAGLLLYASGVPLFTDVVRLLLVFTVLIATVYVKARVAINRPDNARAFEERTVTFSSTDFHQVNQSGIENKIPWAGFVAAERRGRFVMLFVDGARGVAVPDDAFLNDQDRDEAIDLIAKSVKRTGRSPLRGPSL